MFKVKDETLVPYSIRLKPEQIAKIRLLNIDFANWARRRFDEDFTNPEEIDRSIDDLQRQIDSLKQRKILAIKKTEEKNKIPENELNFLLETKELLDKQPKYTDGRISSYSYTFGKPKMSEAEFRELLEKAASLNNNGKDGEKDE